MARLPKPGGDHGDWGSILNDYLSQVHKSDGTLKDNVIGNNAIAPNAVTASEIQDASIQEDQLAHAIRQKLDKDISWALIADKPAVIAEGQTVSEVRNSIGVTEIRVSNYIATTATKKAAIEAAIAEAGMRPNGIVNFEGKSYVTESTVSIAVPGITLTNGGIIPNGQFPALQVSAPDVTVQQMIFSRSTSAGITDSLSYRSCVSVNAARFKSISCDYKASNHACVYLSHGLCNGAVIIGGSMTGASVRQDASGVYAAAGSTGNKNIRIEGVYIYDLPQGILLFDASNCHVLNNHVEHLRKLPTIALIGWTKVSGNIWRQRSASGVPGVDGVTTDRNDGNTRVIYVNGTYTGEVVPNSTSPVTNTASISGGYVYINLNGLDPNEQTITSIVLSGYAYMVYSTGSEVLCRYNKFINNHAEDIDGFGIYLQLGNNVGAVGNHVIGNTLKNVCLEGVQHPSLAFAGIGVGGGNDSLLMGNSIDTVGSIGKAAPGVQVIPGTNNIPSGRIIGTTVRNGTQNGFQISAPGWIITGCQALYNASNGFVITSNITGAQLRGIILTACVSAFNSGEGFSIDGSLGSPNYISARIIGGSAYGNSLRGVVLFGGVSNATVRDCVISDMELRDNGGSSAPQLRVRATCTRITIENCHMLSVTTGAIGLQVESAASEVTVGTNHYNLTNPELLSIPVRTGGSLAGSSWRGSGTPEGAVSALVGATYQRSDGGVGTTFYVKESGDGSTGWVAK